MAILDGLVRRAMQCEGGLLAGDAGGMRAWSIQQHAVALERRAGGVGAGRRRKRPHHRVAWGLLAAGEEGRGQRIAGPVEQAGGQAVMLGNGKPIPIAGRLRVDQSDRAALPRREQIPLAGDQRRVAAHSRQQRPMGLGLAAIDPQRTGAMLGQGGVQRRERVDAGFLHGRETPRPRPGFSPASACAATATGRGVRGSTLPAAGSSAPSGPDCRHGNRRCRESPAAARW